ncbi:MAG: transcriptional repressor [bacterium]|nr:MAG: transcriptional repressor [bacterium]
MNAFSILEKSKLPLDVQTLVEKLKVNKTTVYRQLEKLIKNNKVIEVELGEGKKRYEVKSLDHHHHLICKKCGKLEDISLDEEVLMNQVSKKTKFNVESHSLEFFGHCVKCN